MCISCREMKPKKELSRIVVPSVVGKPESENQETVREAILDTRGKVSGRGAYLCHNPECLKRAKKSRALERALTCSISNDIWEMLEKEAVSSDE